MADSIETMSLAELKELKKKVDKAIDTFQTRRKQEAVEALQALAKEQGFNLSDLIDAASTSKQRSQAAPKYANPKNSDQTWSGRGRKPSWFIEAVASGKSPEDLAV